MKVVCIDNEYWEYFLTINKTYKVIDYNDYDYLIIDDEGYKWRYLKEHFKPLSEIRIEKINKLLKDESSMYR